ncbi:hypothetical protein [Celeribacter sp. PS-C1]|uniref:hypothetical protein n=1 Tax=Celeribacter sp. PS-C1 TaxID=2820813 RepID=UPI001CA5E2EF|nr:hypothetical protein [Celeribacter sp. PS-C1]MBW6419513.1 hypothetical protein [Celeribacter sp. PS-C1]
MELVLVGLFSVINGILVANDVPKEVTLSEQVIEQCEEQARIAAAVAYWVKADDLSIPVDMVTKDYIPVYEDFAREFRGSYREFGDLIKRECYARNEESMRVSDILKNGY